MATPDSDLVRIGSNGDVICAAVQMLGFTPADSLVAVSTHGSRRRIGLVLRFDLDLEVDPEDLALEIDDRLSVQGADEVFFMIFDETVLGSERFAHAPLVVALMEYVTASVLDVLHIADRRWWSLLCADSQCCSPAGTVVDLETPGATAIAAAYALTGKGVLPDRHAIVESVAYSGSPTDRETMRRLILQSRVFFRALSPGVRRRIVLHRIGELRATLADPRAEAPERSVADLVALAEDVLVRDEILVSALDAEARRSLVRVLHEVVRHVPPPLDAPLCAALAWVAYVQGDGVFANVVLDRALRSDPDYSLAQLIQAALLSQAPPLALERVTFAAADLMHGSEGDEDDDDDGDS